MNIVVLTNKNSNFGKKVLNRLILDGLKANAVIVIKQPPSYNLKLFNSVKKRVGIWDALCFSIEKIFQGEKHLRDEKPIITDYSKLAQQVFFTRGTNTIQTINILKMLSPDILILGQTGIVKKEILEIPKLGTLNAHPGILPFYRGIDCWKWAVYNNEFDKIGCSVHWVDTGVDTGNIIAVKRNDISNPDFACIENTLYDNCILLLSNVLQRLKTSYIEGTKQEKETGKQYYKMSKKLEKTVKDKLENIAVRTDRKKI
ncbi:MAG: formyltransferase family protein [bacterium]|nr:formyltransferase family protein [bacterium]